MAKMLHALFPLHKRVYFIGWGWTLLDFNFEYSLTETFFINLILWNCVYTSKDWSVHTCTQINTLLSPADQNQGEVALLFNDI